MWQNIFLPIDNCIANHQITKCVLHLDYASQPKNSTEAIYGWNPQLLSCQPNTIYSLGKMRVSFERIPQRTRTIALEETEVGREAENHAVCDHCERRKLYRREFIHRLLFNRNTFHPPLPGYLCFKTTRMGSSTTKILRSGVSRFLNLCNEGKKKNISKNRSRVIHFQREKFMLIHWSFQPMTRDL